MVCPVDGVAAFNGNAARSLALPRRYILGLLYDPLQNSKKGRFHPVSDLLVVRLSQDLVNGVLYQTVPRGGQTNAGLLVSSRRESIEISFETLAAGGLCPSREYLSETKNGLRIVVPPTLSVWSTASLDRFLAGDMAPVTAREAFEEQRSFIERFVRLPDLRYLDLISLLAVLSFVVVIFPAIPIIVLRGGVGVGKTTLLNVLSSFSRSPLLCSSSTLAALSRARALDPCTLLLDEALSTPGDPLVLSSYKRDAGRLLCGPGNELRRQSLFGLTIAVAGCRSSEAFEDRTINVSSAPSQVPLPPFLLDEQIEVASRLRDQNFWLAMTQFENIREAYREVRARSSLKGRSLEKWSPLLGLAKYVDSSDRSAAPISPGIESLMEEQVSRQREERAAVDPSLLALSGTEAFLASFRKEGGESPVVAACDLAQFLSDYTSQSFTIQQVGFLLRAHGVITRTYRTRLVESMPGQGSNHYPKTVYELDRALLREAQAAHGLDVQEGSETQTEVKSWCS